MNMIYIISVTIIDIIFLINKQYTSGLKCFNNIMRNHYIRISFSFCLGNIFIYWILLLLGDVFLKKPTGFNDICICIYLYILTLFFLLFDICCAHHINKKYYLLDIFIITFILGIYYICLFISDYVINFYPYKFLKLANERETSGTAIIFYLIILNGYIVFCLIAYFFFEQEENDDCGLFFKKLDNSSYQNNNYSGTRLELAETNDNTLNIANEKDNVFKSGKKIEFQNAFLNSDNIEEQKEKENNRLIDNKITLSKSEIIKNPFYFK